MPLIPIGHHHYILPGGEQVVTYKNSEVLQKITRTQGNPLRKAETESYLKKKAKELLQQWTKELREASTKYHQCVIHIKELARIQATGEPPPDKSLILVKKLRLKRSIPDSPHDTPSPPPTPPTAPATKTPRPPKRSRIPISTWRKNDKGRFGGRYIDGAKIPKFLKDGEDPPVHEYQPVTPSKHVWSPEPGSASGRFSRVGSTARRRPRTAPNESELLIGLRDDVRKKINFRAL
ncbi:hypothetical protein TWF506_004426 [Arthrobotrys conoides]|uniref:Uncharacterized protein n=1 Tax=Arthrobotrys conoides TaxID=74498 RepID=A0AAN8RPJ0_9PEZI